MVQLKGYLKGVKNSGKSNISSKVSSSSTVIVRKKKGFLSWLFS
jgi:hypothetical protein